jgi:hypothetical protein
MNIEEKREQRLKLLDDHIGQHLRGAETSGELKAAPSYGKPLNFGDGYDETPDALRMPMKMLKDSGFVPPEIDLMQRIAALQKSVDACADEAEQRSLRQRISEMQQALALRLEKLRVSGSL